MADSDKTLKLLIELGLIGKEDVQAANDLIAQTGAAACALAAEAQFTTTNTVVSSVTNQGFWFDSGNQVMAWNTNSQVVQVTNVVIAPIWITNHCPYVLTASDNFRLQTIFATKKSDGEVTGNYGAWLDGLASADASSIVINWSSQLEALNQARLLKFYAKAAAVAQSNAIVVLQQ